MVVWEWKKFCGERKTGHLVYSVRANGHVLVMKSGGEEDGERVLRKNNLGEVTLILPHP